MSQHTETIAFRPKRTQRTETLEVCCVWDVYKERVARRRFQLAQRHPATVAKRLVFIYCIVEDIKAGLYAD